MSENKELQRIEPVPERMKVCSVPGCDRKSKAHGICNSHYGRFFRVGDVKAHIPIGAVVNLGRTPTDELLRFWSKVRVDEKTDCWLWEGSKVRGYGQFRLYHGRNRKAHSVAYEQLVSTVPVGLTLDHLCRNKVCVNPKHMEIVTNAVNILRGYSPPAQNARKTHCVRGHPLEGHNLKTQKDGHRQCRKCLAIRSKLFLERHK